MHCSGPSLEIISDTEEWLTDVEMIIKEEPSSSGGSKSKKIKVAKGKTKRKKNDHSKQKVNSKVKRHAPGANTENATIKVKKENEKEISGSTSKEGESLLDLLELEMRARAIRALIRKEEDVAPSAASEKRMELTTSALRNTLNSAVSASLSNEKTLNGSLNLAGETIDNPDKSSTEQTLEIGDDDVVFVVAQSTPTIELLSSDNEEETIRNDKANKKTKDSESPSKSRKNIETGEKATDVGAIRETGTITNERIVTIDKSMDGTANLKIVITKRVSESSSTSPSPSKSKRNSSKVDKSAVPIGNEKINEKSPTDEPNTCTGLFKKIKKKKQQNLRTKRKTIGNVTGADREEGDKSSTEKPTQPFPEANNLENDKKEVTETVPTPSVTIVKVEVEESQTIKTAEPKMNKKRVKRKKKPRIPIDEDALDDMEEIINLDDYSDDMDDMENNDDEQSLNEEEESVVSETQNEPKLHVEDTAKESPAKGTSDSAETWATRYYQTDDVQNVIKESKIQSEIRKRLRERQRLSKLSTSPKLNSPGDTTVVNDKPEEKSETKPTGSVQEYMALKNSTTTSVEDCLEKETVGEDKISDTKVDKPNSENLVTVDVPTVSDTNSSNHESLTNISVLPGSTNEQ